MSKKRWIVLVALLAGCGLQVAGPPAPSGSYVLMTVDNEPLPYAPARTGQIAAAEITGSQLNLNADWTFDLTMTYRTVEPGRERVFSRGFEGTYGPADGRFVMDWAGAGHSVAVMVAESFVVEAEGLLFTYAWMPTVIAARGMR